MLALARAPHDRPANLSVHEVVAAILSDLGIARPPIDARLVAKRLGFRIHQRSDELAGMGFRGYKMNEDPNSEQTPGIAGCIYVDQLDRPERVQWITAHEIGELVLPGRVGDEISSDAIQLERACDEFATELLLPRDWFFEHCRQVRFDLLELKAIFSTASHEVIAKRMLAHHEPCVISIFDQDRRPRRFSNLGYSMPPVSFADGVIQRTVRTTGEAIRETRQTTAGGMEVAGWPVHDKETGWKREILRTTYDEWAA